MSSCQRDMHTDDNAHSGRKLKQFRPRRIGEQCHGRCWPGPLQVILLPACYDHQVMAFADPTLTFQLLISTCPSAHTFSHKQTGDVTASTSGVPGESVPGHQQDEPPHTGAFSASATASTGQSDTAALLLGLQVRVCLVINKMDRLIQELALTPQEAYIRLHNIITHVNMNTSAF